MTEQLPTNKKDEPMRTSALGTRRNRSKKIYKLAGLLVVLIAVVFVGTRFFSSNQKNSPDTSTLGKISKNIELDHSFKIPILDSDGEGTGKSISYKLISAELTDEIIIKGQRATALNDRIFLVLNVALSNPQEDGVKVDTRNYVRLSTNGSQEKLAPNVHNDPVEVQPISDQPTRIGFSINREDGNYTIFVGEISGDKTEISLNFD